MRKQVSRLRFNLLGRLPAVRQWLMCPFVRFTVTGVARNFHPYSLVGVCRQRLCQAQMRTLFI